MNKVEQAGTRFIYDSEQYNLKFANMLIKKKD